MLVVSGEQGIRNSNVKSVMHSGQTTAFVFVLLHL